ncbi:MAG: NAD-dependent succinate-semialdehyde dehydrogenase [Inhella sp.]|jgi:succinate-semialdehyde dehydrogenase/glutarate-semialdehyde dehydrogenase|uniref:NAD-dependent succinate-semialdehyde dehydrogenase n=1 Tax=Inhella sp. TaxID=1921806 RepID=UPI0022BE97DD|nr:NAD-dependent succinate-semialdehyde dehydrogenase [Inhella sp.]MCZ8236284.1 NAD-dependent succinate-semialdehyde dehydrogenase [Inhella sp.]
MSEADTALPALHDASLLRVDALLGGEWVSGPSRFAVHNPATGTHLADVTSGDADQARLMVEAAERALPSWRSRSARERGLLLSRWAQLLRQNADDLAQLMTAEQGKPLAEARGEVSYAASFLEWYAEEGKRVYGETIPSSDGNKRQWVWRQPVGVCAAITPWNFPLAMITRKVAPALAAGCTVMVKPAEQTPLTALACAELALRAGLPAGVLAVLPANADDSIAVGQVWCAHPGVRHLSFTGSTEVGRILMAQCAPTLKRLSMELGGHAPFIVFDDADLDSAVEGAVQAKYRNSGQTCISANRLLVQAGIHDAFVERLAERVAALHLGPGTQAGVQVGPVIDASALAKVKAHVDDALALGATARVGGQVRGDLGPTFFEPTLLVGVTPKMRCAVEETFGPVAPVLRFDTEAQALALANASEYGLAAYFYSRDIGRVIRLAEALEYGMVGVNTGLISSAELPFGGVKQSGFGREGGHHGLEEYLDTKLVCVGDVNA